jgi:hypothetical protein
MEFRWLTATRTIAHTTNKHLVSTRTTKASIGHHRHLQKRNTATVELELTAPKNTDAKAPHQARRFDVAILKSPTAFRYREVNACSTAEIALVINSSNSFTTGTDEGISLHRQAPNRRPVIIEKSLWDSPRLLCITSESSSFLRLKHAKSSYAANIELICTHLLAFTPLHTSSRGEPTNTRHSHNLTCCFSLIFRPSI